MNNITNFITHCLADYDRYILTSDIPTDQIAIFNNNLFFNWQKEVAECAEAVRQVVEAEGKRYFVIANHSTFFQEDLCHILESGLAKIAGHAIVYSKTWRGEPIKEGAAVVFEII